MIRTRIIIIICVFLTLNSFGQDRIRSIENHLKSMVADNPGLEATVDVSVSEVPIQEFVRAIAMTNGLNISVAPDLKITVVNTFTNVSVVDVLVFLCKEYNLKIEFVGNIMSITAFEPPPTEPKKYVPKKLDISYDGKKGELSYNLKNDSLFLVAKEITRISDRNVVLAPELTDKMVSGFVQKLAFADAMDKLAFSNGLSVESGEDGSFMLVAAEKDNADAGQKNSNRRNNRSKKGAKDLPAGMYIELSPDSLLTVDGVGVKGGEIIKAVSNELGKNYYLFSEMQEATTLQVENVTYEQFLSYLLNGTDMTFKKEGSIYLIGKRNLEGLRETSIVKLQNRTVEKIDEYIPSDMKQGVTLKIHLETNSIILSGSRPQIREIEAFLKDMDQVVPMVMIEVIIVDVNRTRTDEAGIDMGLGQAPATTGGTLLSGLDFTLNSSSVNNVLAALSGLGTFNLGKVTPNFYVSLKALESQGYLRSRSKPMLSTLNGNKATMTIGNQEYYLETTNNIIGSQNPQNAVTQNYKSVNAALTLNIVPIVSGDGQVTMDISVTQSDFTSRISPSAPPGQVTRDFRSLIRVKDQEMIMLGGLEEKSINDTGKGWPLLSRIPVLKWLFSTRSRKKDKTQLNIFIKPTIVF
ncbi:MAG: general secretion pathway protein GspD [Flavobacteriales bacterium]|nr:general secretion pathway protein GspD [Flavobacteriales bacterium]